MDNRAANGFRQPSYNTLNQEEIDKLLRDIDAIGAERSVFRFNAGNKTGFFDQDNIINVRGDVLPDINSGNPRDRMSARAVLAHEYYGHYKFYPSIYRIGDWRDEMRASYVAAIKTPNLTYEDRAYLIQDAYQRAKEAGYHYEYSKKAREIVYGR